MAGLEDDGSVGKEAQFVAVGNAGQLLTPV